jgi:hypothetical protein
MAKSCICGVDMMRKDGILFRCCCCEMAFQTAKPGWNLRFAAFAIFLSGAIARQYAQSSSQGILATSQGGPVFALPP